MTHHTVECLALQEQCAQEHEAYIRKWTNYCAACGARGYHYWPGTYEQPPESEPCEVCMGQCPRCRFNFWLAGGYEQEDFGLSWVWWLPSNYAETWYNAFCEGTVDCPKCSYTYDYYRRREPGDNQAYELPPTFGDMMGGPCECEWEEMRQAEEEYKCSTSL